MATVLTQSYLLLDEEPLEKITTKLPIKGSSDITNGGMAIECVTNVSSVGNGTTPRLISNGKPSGLNGTEIKSNKTSSLPDVTFQGNGNSLNLTNKLIIAPTNGVIKSESSKVVTTSVGTLPNINGIKSLYNNGLSSDDDGFLKNGSIPKSREEFQMSENINDETSGKLVPSDVTFSVSHSIGIKPNGVTKRAEAINYSEKHDEVAKSDGASSNSVQHDKVQVPVIYKWTNIIAILSVHLLAVYGFGYMAWNWSTRSILFSFLTGGLSGFGVTGGAHRLWTHRAYKAKTPLQIILLFCYTLAGQNTVYEWVRDHRVHHKYSETDADPHNSNRGFFFSHVGWLLTRKHPEVIDKGNKIDMTDITSDPLLEWHRRYFSWLRLLICYILPVWIPMYFWNETFTYAFFSNTVRYAMSLNATWSVNSFAHIWGYKPYDRRIMPVENLGVAIFAMGEGWHNYHHAFPWDYRASEMGYRFNFTAFLIDQFAKIGWAYDLKRPSETLVATMAAKYGEVPRRRDHHFEPIVDPQQTKKSS